jgi:hypothetical protein
MALLDFEWVDKDCEPRERRRIVTEGWFGIERNRDFFLS